MKKIQKKNKQRNSLNDDNDTQSDNLSIKEVNIKNSAESELTSTISLWIERQLFLLLYSAE